jgi:predicted lipid-binding transport protein (Tim44 family)
MKNLLIAMVIAVTSLSIGMSSAEAKRMGGGGSFGKQSQSYNRQSPAQNNQAANNSSRQNQPGAANQAAGAKPSMWKGILGGALLGLGLGALLSHLGIGGALAGMIGTILTFALIAAAIWFLVRMFRRNKAPGAQPAFAGASPGNAYTPEIGSRANETKPMAFNGTAASSGTSNLIDLPADFDVPAFLRTAKTQFIRMQAAWDKADINDLREFTTPEMYAELKLQLQERGASANVTDVVTLEADLLGVEVVGNEYLAGVRFSGMIKEDPNAPVEHFIEIWNLAKPVSGPGGWLLAGIQQS